MPALEAELGETVRLALQLEDGVTSLYPRATIYNGSPVPVAAVDLDHTAMGMYRANWVPGYASNYNVVYRVFSDAGRTNELDYERVMENVSVSTPPDEVRLGVVFDDVADELLVNIHVLRRGIRVEAAQLSSCTLTVFDDDDSVYLGPLADAAPDGEGVFRFSFASPNLTDNRNYVVKAELTLTTHSIVGQKGFKAVP